MKTINLSLEFSDTPGGRYIRFGPDSGEEFRTKFLEPALQHDDVVMVDLNGAYGYGSSFIDEVFGVMVDKMGYEESVRRIQVSLTDNTVARAEIDSAREKHKNKEHQ